MLWPRRNHCVLLHPALGAQQHTMIQAATVSPADTTKFAQEPAELAFCVALTLTLGGQAFTKG
jgi:hypothetical protein